MWIKTYSMIKEILDGIKAYFGAFGMISKLGLWKYFTIPILISIVTGVSIFIAAYFLSGYVGSFIAKLWVWKWGAEGFAKVSTVFGGIFILIIGLLIYKHIVMALSAPFMSPVSEKIEAHLLGENSHIHRDTSFREQLARGIRINIRNFGKELLFTIPLLMLSLIPVVGLVFTILIFVLQAYYVGFGNMDYTMERHFKYKESVSFVKKHRGTAIGNGLIFVGLLFIPILGLIITLPISVVAASTETVKILERENLISSAAATELPENS